MYLIIHEWNSCSPSVQQFTSVDEAEVSYDFWIEHMVRRVTMYYLAEYGTWEELKSEERKS